MYITLDDVSNVAHKEERTGPNRRIFIKSLLKIALMSGWLPTLISPFWNKAADKISCHKELKREPRAISLRMAVKAESSTPSVDILIN
jgi:hypothetical protein